MPGKTEGHVREYRNMKGAPSTKPPTSPYEFRVKGEAAPPHDLSQPAPSREHSESAPRELPGRERKLPERYRDGGRKHKKTRRHTGRRTHRTRKH